MSVNHTYKKPYIVTIACTKGGSAKSTNAANMGAFCADHGLRTLLIDTDILFPLVKKILSNQDISLVILPGLLD